jgi:hypothetical protein
MEEEEGQEDEEEEEGVSTPKADAPKREDSVDVVGAANVPRDARGGGYFYDPPWSARESPRRPCLGRWPPRALALAAMPRMNSPAWYWSKGSPTPSPS